MDKEELERRRDASRQLIDAWIAEQPEDQQERLRAFNWNLQQRIDMIKNPTEQMNEVVKMLYAQLDRFNGILEGDKPEVPLEDNVVGFEKKTVDPED